MTARGVAIALGGFVLVACMGSTGDDVVDFPAAAAGPVDAAVGMKFVTDRGWTVTLDKASLHVGAIYLDQSKPVSGAQSTGCILPGTYVAQITTGMNVDLLSPAPQRFSEYGHGTTLRALVGQVWLTGGDVTRADDPSPPTPVLVVQGTAVKDGDVRAFAGTITIGSNRQVGGGALAGANPICKQRIVSPIATSVTLKPRGGLMLRIDPRHLFANVEFAQLPQLIGTGTYAFSDDPTQTDPESPLYYSQPSVNLYQNLHAGGALYSFSWDDRL